MPTQCKVLDFLDGIMYSNLLIAGMNGRFTDTDVR